MWEKLSQISLCAIPINKLPCGEVGVVVLEGEGVGGELA